MELNDVAVSHHFVLTNYFFLFENTVLHSNHKKKCFELTSWYEVITRLSRQKTMLPFFLSVEKRLNGIDN